MTERQKVLGLTFGVVAFLCLALIGGALFSRLIFPATPDSPSASVPATLAETQGAVPLKDRSFELIVTETPPGPTIPKSAWGGLAVFSFKETGAPAIRMPGVAAGSLSDPQGLAYSTEEGILYVGNRFGGVGPANVIPIEHQAFGPFAVGNALPENGVSHSCQVAINPISGELFVANHTGSISRYLTSGTTVTPNGIINTGTVHGLAVSPDGKRLYASASSTILRRWNIETMSPLSPVRVSEARTLNFMQFRGQHELFVGDNSAGAVFRFNVDDQNNVQLAGRISSPSALAIAFSPDLNELFVSSHGPDAAYINRFLFDAALDEWRRISSIPVGTSMGSIIVLPGTGAPRPPTSAPIEKTPTVATSVPAPSIVLSSPGMSLGTYPIILLTILTISALGILASLIVLTVKLSQRK